MKRDMKSKGFPPIARADAKVLILGTLPSQESLKRGQYYAHPRNAFWRIMGELFGAFRELPYAQRKRRLREQRIALWDVCAAAYRPGSLDASLARVVPNAFAEFFESHPSIELVCFNGGTAAELYRRLVLPRLPAPVQSFHTEMLPSTSPAHAAMSFEKKLERWSVIRRALED